jgi:hypothetical protein
MTHRRPLTLSLLLCALGVCCGRAAADPPNFERHVRPVLKAYCLDCHGAGEKLRGGLDLRLKRFAMKGGKNGPAVIAKDPANSPLLQRLKTGEMPPGEKKVPADQIAVIEKWIAAGAPGLREEPAQLPPGIDITPEERAYWFYQPIRPVAPPAFGPADRVRTPVDAFLLAKLREKKLSFNEDADRLTLIKRATFDLTGLPPTQQEIDAFLADPAADAYEKLIDRLLASPHYGERWARHWLDVAGYADSSGDGVTDTPRPHAWKYRDYVVRAFNEDRPLDRFITEQLAGDELAPPPWNNLDHAKAELLTATGFLRTAPDPTASSNGRAEAEQALEGTLKIVGSALLGLTVGCAQCHDHRYDPIPQADYFRLRAVFEPALNPAKWRTPAQRRVSLYTDADRARAAAVEAEAAKMQAALNERQAKYVRAAFEKELGKFPAEQRDRLRAAFDTPEPKRDAAQKQLVAANPKLNINPGVLYQYDERAADELKKVQEKINAKRAEKPVEDFLDVLNEVPGEIPATHLHYRGDYRQPKGQVQPGDLTIAAPEGARFEIAPRDEKLPSSSGRRLAFARHLTSGNHPLLGRVLVNRIWLHHFGRGIVDTPGDFGVLGQRPTHPELLDWLAAELVHQGWSMKQMHRLLMTSTAYRQSSRRTAAQDAVDAGNALYGRYPLRRLDAEALRDRMLATAGRLDHTLYGPPVPVTEDAVGQGVVPDDKPRRSLYLQARRTKPVSFLAAFDAPTGELNCERRQAATNAPQALMLMNGDFALQQAGHLARRIRAEMPADYERAALAGLIARFPRHAEAWQYGYGTYDPGMKRLARFAPLPHWTGSAWQGGPVLPDPKLGWVIVHAAGGHAGDDAARASVRRWVAPRDGTVAVSGKFGHASPSGDGVRGRVVSGRQGLLGEWTVKNQQTDTAAAAMQVKAGDTLDFVVDCRENVNADSYTWAATVTLTDTAGGKETWSSATDFRGPSSSSLVQQAAFAWRLVYQRPASPEEIELACRFLLRQNERLRAAGNADPELAALTNLCQQLLSSNEFLYVD